MIKVSVVIPVYKLELYLGQCLDSILGQTLNEIEVICVDVGSTDNSISILETYQSMDKRVKILRQNNSNAGTARNNGMNAASGEYIVFLDSDTFFEREMLETMYEKCKRDSADICICGGGVYNQKNNFYQDVPHYLNMNDVPENMPFSASEIREKIFNFVSSASWNKMFRRQFILEQKIEFQSLKGASDLYFVYLALACAERITIVDRWFVNYRTGNDNSLQTTNENSLFDWYKALLALRNSLRERKLFSEFERSFKNRALDVAIYNLNRAKTIEDYKTLFERLKTECFYKLEIVGHTKPYFYIQDNFSQMIVILESSAEQTWKKKIDILANRKEDVPLFDIKTWERPEIQVDDNGIAVSVIIPVYNAKEYLEECLESVVKQSLKNIEIICIDDGSIDHSIEILNKYKNEDERIIILRKENGGVSSARNAGLEIATGEYICFLDSDDYLDLRALEFLYYEAKKDYLDQLFFSAEPLYDHFVDDHRYSFYQDFYKRYGDYSQITSGKEYFIQVIGNAEFKPAVTLQFFRANYIFTHHLKFLNGLIHEDQLFTVQSLAFSERVRYININLLYRRVRDGSIMTGTSKFKHAYAYYRIIKELIKFEEEYHLVEYKAYFDMLKIHLERLRDLACREINAMDVETLKSELDKLGAMERMDFYFYICAYNQMKEKAYRSNLRSKAAEENAKSQVFKKKHQIETIKRQVDDVAKLMTVVLKQP